MAALKGLNIKLSDWSLNGRSVPMQEMAVPCVDPENLGVGLLDIVEGELQKQVAFVSFKASADMR